MTAVTRVRPFESEAEMAEPIVAEIHRLHGRGEVHAVTREQRGALKVPDLVAATLGASGTGCEFKKIGSTAPGTSYSRAPEQFIPVDR